MDDDKTDIMEPTDFDKEVDGLARHTKQQRKRKNLSILVACLAVIIAAVAAAIALEARASDNPRIHDLTQKANTNADRLDEVAKQLEEQRKQFELCKNLPKTDARCQQPIAPPVTVTPERPTDTITIPPSLTTNDVRSIVATEVARRNLTLTPAQITTIATSAAKLVPKPANGKTPTKAELQPLASAAVATFCANGACRGDDGKPGTPGADAPPPTDERLTAILAAYCEPRNDCIGGEGAPGKEGSPGPAGPAGRGIASTTISGDTITFAYTDGTKDTVVVPLCPEGSSSQKQRVNTDEFPLGVWVNVCVLQDQNP